MKVVFGLALLGLTSLGAAEHQHGDSAVTKTRSVAKLADGVFMIRHPDAPNSFPQGNTLVVIGGKEVLVVDSCYLPSSAAEDLKQIRTWTDKPIKYLVNTHWHFDHTMGNGVYATANPGMKIIAHKETQKRIAGMNASYIARFPEITANLQRVADTGKLSTGEEVSDKDRKDYAEAAKGQAAVLEEYKNLIDKAPDTTFEEKMEIDLGGRQVQILFLGKGNTAGDAVVYLPKEKILATGDLLDSPVPYLGGGFPVDLVLTLRRLREMEVNTFVPGHGNALTDKSHLTNVIDFIDEVLALTQAEIFKLGNNTANEAKVVAAVKEKMDVAKWKAKFGGGDDDNESFFEGFSLGGVLKAAFRQLVGS